VFQRALLCTIEKNAAAAAPLVIRPTVAARLQPFKPLASVSGGEKGDFLFKGTSLTPITLLSHQARAIN